MAAVLRSSATRALRSRDARHGPIPALAATKSAMANKAAAADQSKGIGKRARSRQLERHCKTVAVVFETAVVKLHRLMEGQIGQRGGQPGKSSRSGATHKYRHHVCFASKSGRYFVNHVVLLARRGAVLEYLNPARTYNHQYCRALRERLIDGLGKVLTWSDVFNVHEDTMDAHEGAKVIGNAASVGSCVVAPIIDEDVVRGGGLSEKILDVLACSHDTQEMCRRRAPFRATRPRRRRCARGSSARRRRASRTQTRYSRSAPPLRGPRKPESETRSEDDSRLSRQRGAFRLEEVRSVHTGRPSSSVSFDGEPDEGGARAFSLRRRTSADRTRSSSWRATFFRHGPMRSIRVPSRAGSWRFIRNGWQG